MNEVFFAFFTLTTLRLNLFTIFHYFNIQLFKPILENLKRRKSVFFYKLYRQVALEGSELMALTQLWCLHELSDSRESLLLPEVFATVKIYLSHDLQQTILKQENSHICVPF